MTERVCEDYGMSSPPVHAGRRDRLQANGHYLTALVLATEGVSKLDRPEGYQLFIALCWLCSAAIVVVTAAHHRLEQRFPPLQMVIHLAGGAVCAGLVFVTVHEGKVGLPFAWLAATLLLSGVAALELLRFIRNRRVAA
jgi:hypothetical protein